MNFSKKKLPLFFLSAACWAQADVLQAPWQEVVLEATCNIYGFVDIQFIDVKYKLLEGAKAKVSQKL
ncbi:MAG: hypothetical protein ACRC37_01790 [Lentisphaeria bacterium]